MKKVRTEFQWLTSIRLTEKNAEKKRWKIENEGSNRQKTGREILRMSVAGMQRQ